MLRSLEDISAIDIADVLLCSLTRRRARGLLIEPSGEDHLVTLMAGGGRTSVFRLPAALGDAVAVRLGVIAGIDVWAPGPELGMRRVHAGSASNDLLVILRQTPLGLAGEVRRLQRLADPDVSTGAWHDTAAPKRIGRYRVLDVLGSGGMGVVYRAELEAGGAPVAIKVLHREFTADPETAVQLVKEGRAAALADDTGIVKVTGFGTLDDGRPYLVMELVEAETLEASLARGPFSVRQALRVARQIALALRAAHVRGVIHRDLKPSNIFLGRQVKIGDFGAAQVLSSRSERAGTKSRVLGTPLYMAPEHARGQATDERTDVYALGCILFRMLAGHAPYEGPTTLDVFLKHASTPVPKLRSPHGPLPSGLEALVARALAKVPEERFQSVGELGDQLDAVARGLPPEEG